ncbi:MAG: class I SAM-dependent rRNA methyltransferase, partial [Lentisphaeria bacterium]|nr:class I SAM-dependent rRNA methyltransferase [Lentisphaeria bacterium]
MSEALAVLKQGREKSILRGHPWIFSGALKKLSGKTGDTVRVVDSEGNFLAWGACSPDSAIPVKIWSFGNEAEKIDASYFERKLEQAFLCRKTVFNGVLPDAYRLVNAESDGLPGLVADVYNDCCVCQITGAGMDRFRDVIAQQLLRYAPRSVYERSDVESRLRDGLSFRTGLLAGTEPPEFFRFSENNICFFADPRNGHKTGFYLDQRISRKTVMEAAAGAEDALNCFSYTGGFGL